MFLRIFRDELFIDGDGWDFGDRYCGVALGDVDVFVCNPERAEASMMDSPYECTRWDVANWVIE